MMVFRSAISIRLVPRRVSIRLLMPVSQLFDGWQAERILEIAVGENPSPTGSSPTGDPRTQRGGLVERSRNGETP